MRRVFVLCLAVATLLIGLPPAHAATPTYVALGDSFAAGTGTRSYVSDGTSCQRSIYAYPSLLASSRGYSLSLRACSGARVADVAGTQLSALTASTTYVSVTVGGNDAGFTDVLTQCALPAWMSDCFGRVNSADNLIRTQLPARLAGLYAQIRQQAPQARVTVVGYPRLFNGTDCNALTWFSAAEMSRLNASADLLNTISRQQAQDAGFSFADPTDRFLGHAVCDRSEWINGLSLPVSESFHPNRNGHASGYLPAVAPVLTGAPLAATRNLSAARALAAVDQDRSAVTATLTVEGRRYAALDSRIAPEHVAPVDLHSPTALAAAARAGVDVNDLASVDAADRVWSARQATSVTRR